MDLKYGFLVAEFDSLDLWAVRVERSFLRNLRHLQLRQALLDVLFFLIRMQEPLVIGHLRNHVGQCQLMKDCILGICCLHDQLPGSGHGQMFSECAQLVDNGFALIFVLLIYFILLRGHRVWHVLGSR